MNDLHSEIIANIAHLRMLQDKVWCGKSLEKNKSIFVYRPDPTFVQLEEQINFYERMLEDES